MPLVWAIPPVRGRPRQRPGAVYGDRAYDHDKYRGQVRDKGITPVIARRSTEHGVWLGRAPLGDGADRRAALVPAAADPREIRDDIHEAFPSLACAIICWRRLANLSLC
jgi:hypothetical protein